MPLFGGIVPIKHIWRVSEQYQGGVGSESWYYLVQIDCEESPSTWLTEVSFSTMLEGDSEQMIKLTESWEIDIKVAG